MEEDDSSQEEYPQILDESLESVEDEDQFADTLDHELDNVRHRRYPFSGRALSFEQRPPDEVSSQNLGYENFTPSGSTTPVLTPTSFCEQKFQPYQNRPVSHPLLTASLDPDEFRTLPMMQDNGTPRRTSAQQLPMLNSPRAPRTARRSTNRYPYPILSSSSELNLKLSSPSTHSNGPSPRNPLSRTEPPVFCHASSHPSIERPSYRRSPTEAKGLLPTLYDPQVPRQRVSRDTLVDVLNGRYSRCLDKVYILDCRSPREFEGGHIKNAINVQLDEMDQFFEDRLHELGKTNSTMAFIFHCEFSKLRGPKCWDRFRGLDRRTKGLLYPQVFFPSCYVLDGGYKTFFQRYQNYCEPQAYVPQATEPDPDPEVEFSE